HAMSWNTQTPKITVATIDTIDAPPPPAPREEMALFNRWQGTWPNKHFEGSAEFDGTFDSKLVNRGNFLVWFDKTIVKDSTGKPFNNHQVDIWGFSDVSHKYYRVDVATSLDKPITPQVVYTPWFVANDAGQGLMLIAPLEKRRVANETQPTRYAIGM